MKRLTVLGLVIVAAGSLVATGCAKQVKKTKASAAGLQRIHFDFDKSDIKSEFEPVLRQNAAWAQSNSKTSITVEGHCDERGSIEYNIALGDRRANAAKSYLQNLGVEAKRLSTISYGEERPIATCHDESCWWQNRRAEFVSK